MEIRKYMKFYGPINGIVCIGLGLLLFTFNVLLIELEEVTMRILMFGPIPLILTGTSLLLFPGAKLTRKEVHNKKSRLSIFSLSKALQSSVSPLMARWRQSRGDLFHWYFYVSPPQNPKKTNDYDDDVIVRQWLFQYCNTWNYEFSGIKNMENYTIMMTFA